MKFVQTSQLLGESLQQTELEHAMSATWAIPVQKLACRNLLCALDKLNKNKIAASSEQLYQSQDIPWRNVCYRWKETIELVPYGN